MNIDVVRWMTGKQPRLTFACNQPPKIDYLAALQSLNTSDACHYANWYKSPRFSSIVDIRKTIQP